MVFRYHITHRHGKYLHPAALRWPTIYNTAPLYGDIFMAITVLPLLLAK